ncbi:hypothetical protein [Kineococcus xinjiangensis]|nr:hypothetical protein [Kineococcus xinjiangensis]
MSSIDPATYVPGLFGEAPEDELPAPALPAYLGPPRGVRPGSVPVALTLGESEQAVVLLTTVKAFPTGLSMIVTALVKGPAPGSDIGDPFSEGGLRWSIGLPDGQRVTGTDPLPERKHPNAQRLRPFQPEDANWRPEHAVLRRGGAAGSSEVFDQEYWLWPLPTTGRLRITCQWPERGIGATVHDLDVQPFREAAARARPVHKTVELGTAPGWQAFDPDDPQLRQLHESSQRPELGVVRVTVYDLARGGSAVSAGGPGAGTVELIDAAIAELQEARRIFATEAPGNNTGAPARS